MSSVKNFKPTPLLNTSATANLLNTSAAANFACAGLAPTLSILVTSPADVIKARMQIDGEVGRACMRKDVKGFPIVDIVREEGVRGLYRGVGVSMAREAALNVIRLGLYDPLMSQMHSGYKNMESVKETGLPPMYKQILCGSVCGVLGSLLANPLELVKCRIQCAGPATDGYRYSGFSDAVRQIVSFEGISGLWNGARIFALRNAVGSAANLTTFSTCKGQFLQWYPDSVAVDVACAMVSGLATTLIMSPIDVIKTRFQNQPMAHAGQGAWYSNSVDAAVRIIRNEGVGAFWKGFTSLYIRTGPHYVLTFTIYGLLKRWTSDTEHRS